MASPLILAIDQGTSSTKSLLVDAAGKVVAIGSAPLGQSAPQPGWVEQDALEIWQSVQRAVAAAVTPETAGRIVAVGLSTQRESCVIWERSSGKPLTPVLSWQDQRTEGLCAELRAECHSDYVRKTSGLPLDPMFSAAKAKWLLDRIDPDRRRADAGEIVVGTIDAFLLSRFGGEPLVEAGNASRMQLVDVAKADYDDRLLALFGIPRAALPRIVPSTGPFPAVRGLAPVPDGVPVTAVLADSHAALFAHGAFAPGPVKATQGTGSSVMGLLDRPATNDGASLHKGLCVTLAWWIDAPMLAFEGNIRSAGSTLIWTADLLGVGTDELARMAALIEDAGNVHLVPGFNGLGAPWWDGVAVATLSGFALGTKREVVARAALDSIAHQIADLIDAVRESGVAVDRLHVDGGPTKNAQLMQFEADMIGLPVETTETAELSAMGAAHLAGVSAGLFDLRSLGELDRGGLVYTPAVDEASRAAKRAGWRRAVARSLSSGMA
ncbi:Glycerol kinase [Hartmannibacter diazotrophicus]|uniref:Glycerol kinase n=1 Tax=Hartmannibacter diazotrophicus TaxID=1482074 RepID=A0A2C9D1Z3_9HYPH|nr:FGGY family carbohydrate kinase [Hartmannibacter diazotrophicus]SON54397.1 Glycerol kinase [Hartmannibacter diazotrophicus]